MNRITEAHLKAIVNRLNVATGSPVETYTKPERQGDKYIANIGNYHLDWAYGGVKLVRMCNDGGGIRCISNDGFGTKRELYNFVVGMLEGIAAVKGD